LRFLHIEQAIAAVSRVKEVDNFCRQGLFLVPRPIYCHRLLTNGLNCMKNSRKITEKSFLSVDCKKRVKILVKQNFLLTKKIVFYKMFMHFKGSGRESRHSSFKIFDKVHG